MTKNLEDITHEDLDYLYDELIEAARNDFYIFVKLLASEILPEGFIDGRHIEMICKELQSVEASVANKDKKCPERLQLFMPPGSMKSKLASNLFPAWCLGKHPNWCFLAIGSSFEFSVDNFGRPTKDLIELDQYQAIFPDTILKKDVQAAGRWDTTKKGRFVACGVGQGIAGRRAHITICDDVMTEQTTEIERKKINNWYQKGLRTRLLPSGGEVIINTRWHLEDLSGHMEKIDSRSERPWKIVSLPALLNEEAQKLLKREGDSEELYQIGTSFWPEFWSTEVLLEKKETLPPNEWNALYMQSPTPEEGAIIKRHDFRIWDGEKPPPCMYIIVSMDTAFSIKETADYSAYTVWGVFKNIEKDFDGNDIQQNNVILLSCGKGRWEFYDLCNKAQEIYTKYEPDFYIIEDRASGQSLIQELRRRNLPVLEYLPDKDKLFRLHACTPFFKAGRVWIPADKRWAEELVEEVIAFPSVPHDDLTDTLSQAILWLRDSYNIDNDGYPKYDEEEKWSRRRGRNAKTYWSSVIS
jgi:predicted phage terminase large subunit-like protein